MSDISSNIRIESSFSVTREIVTATDPWDLDTPPALQKCEAMTYFVVTDFQNPASDSTRQLDENLIKIYPAFNTIVERYSTTDPWDNKEDGSNLTLLDFHTYILPIETVNPHPDPLRDISDQEIKIYPFFFLDVSNPPWIKAKLDIFDIYDAQAINPPLYTEELMWIEDTFYSTESHTLHEKITVNTRFATGAVTDSAIAENITIDDTYKAVPISRAVTNEDIVITPSLSITYSAHPTKISAKLELFSYALPVDKQMDYEVFLTNVSINDTVEAHSNNPPIELQARRQGVWITSFLRSYVEPQDAEIREKINVSERWVDIVVDNGGTIDPTPDTDSGAIYEEEQQTEYINIHSDFSTQLDINYRDVLAIGTFIAHNPNAKALYYEGLAIHFANTIDGLNPNRLHTDVSVKDFLKISTQETKNILEFVRISDFYRAEGGTSEEEYTTYVINEDNETTRYEHWPFESYAAFKGVHFGCGPDGIYELTGDDDNGEPIAAMINFGKQSFGSSQMKRVPYVYASLASDGDLYMQVSYTDDNVYMYPARKVDEYNATVRFDLGRGIKANYLNFELYNENGSKFDLRNVWIYLTELSRRI